MVIDGSKIARELRGELARAFAQGARRHLTVFTCDPTFETKQFLAIKKRTADELGVGLAVVEFPREVSAPELTHSIQQAVRTTDGIVVQLPLPSHLDAGEVLTAIPPSHDVDALTYDGGDSEVLPPVVGAIAEIARRHQVSFLNQQVVVVGRGRLVGAPAALWARRQGAAVSVTSQASPAQDRLLREADIIIAGAGVPGLITREQLKPGVVVFDAGTSEAEGVLAGDVDPGVAEIASLFTPVPGGIGPITVAVLFRNLATLAARR